MIHLLIHYGISDIVNLEVFVKHKSIMRYRWMNRYFDINSGHISIKSKQYCNNPRGIARVIISCHGFGGNKDNNFTAKMAEVLLSKYDDLAIISFDWPCHGNDVKQKPSLTDCNDYLQCVIEYVKNDPAVDEVYIQATSFGGYLVLKYISEHGNPVKKIALRCPAVNMYDSLMHTILSEGQVEELGKGKFQYAGFDRKIKVTPEFIQELKENDIMTRDFIDMADDILIMHGTADELISYDVDRQFCDDNVIEFITIEGADHRFKNPAKLRECINNIESFFF